MTKILIAEDERDIRDLVTFTLQFGGYEVVATGNGAEAVELAPSEKPDLIVMDVRMPKMTGYEACVALKANPETAQIPVIFLSAKGQETEVSTGMGAGAAAYILKPFAPDLLIAKIKEVLATHGTPAASSAAPPSGRPAASSAAPSGDRPAASSAPSPGDKPAAGITPSPGDSGKKQGA